MRMPPPIVSKNVDAGRSGDKNPALIQLGAIVALAAAMGAIFLHLIPRDGLAFSRSTLFDALGLQAAVQMRSQVAYIIVAIGVFLFVSVIKFFVKNPSLREPKYWPFIWWPVVILDTLFDALYVVTVYFGRFDLFLAGVAAMIAIDAIILNDRGNEPVAYIVAFDVVEALAYGGLTVLFTNLVALH